MARIETEVLVAGGGPGGLAVAETTAKSGINTVVLERKKDVGNPIRTSGGIFIRQAEALGIPSDLYHPIHRARFISPSSSIIVDYDKPVMCVMDVYKVFNFLAERAMNAGAEIKLGTRAIKPIIKDNFVVLNIFL